MSQSRLSTHTFLSCGGSGQWLKNERRIWESHEQNSGRDPSAYSRHASFPALVSHPEGFAMEGDADAA